MKKLFTCLYGSKLYGTDHPDSDRDVKHIILPELDSLLLGKKVVTVEKKTNTEANTRNTKDDVDEKFIPVQIFAKDFMMGYTEALEVAFAIDGTHCEQTFYDVNGTPIRDVENISHVYDEHEVPFYTFTRELREKFLTSNIRALVSYVINQSTLYSLKGERLNACRALRDLLGEIESSLLKDESKTVRVSAVTDKFGPKFEELAVNFPEYFAIGTYNIANDRVAPCFRILGKTLPHTNTVHHTITTVDALISRYGARADSASATNVDWKATMHAMRIVDEGLTLLREGRLEFPLLPDHISRLLQIRHGEVDIGAVREEFNFKVDLLSDLEKTTKLPPYTQEMQHEFDIFMAWWMKNFYRIL